MPASWEPILNMVDQAYHEFDRDRHMIERSMEISAQELLEANADIRAVLEGLVDLFLRIDEAGIILNCRSRHTGNLLNIGPRTVGLFLPDVVPPELRQTFDNLVADIRCQPSFFQTEISTGQGPSRHTYDLRVIPAHHRQVNIILRDITEAKRAEERNRDLESKLARSEKMESLGLLAGGVAHDLNNILAPLVTYPEIILEDLHDQPETRKLVEKIEQSATRASAIIQDLLTLARRGNRLLEPLCLNQAIRDYLGSAEHEHLATRYPNHRLTVTLEESLPLIFASPPHVSQTIMNLVTNAYEANPYEGNITIATSRFAQTNQAGPTSDQGTFCLLKISDDGVGMTPEETTKIFDPFYSTKKPGASGTGLGLSVVYGTIKDAKGCIDVRSSPGNGSTFDLYFPALLEPVSEDDATRIPDSGVTTNTATILTVDDQSEQREMVEMILKRSGYNVVCAANGREGVHLLSSHPVDLVLLDMIMEPDYDGLQAYLDMKAIRPNLPCLIVTGYAETDRVRQVMEAGAAGLIAKPYTSKSLLSEIEKILHARSGRSSAT
ncbi:MAG TPA: response regulator [Kiritimatiellia bacterium]|nr:response regulator [Kiritimatiellia bacterium]